MLPVPHPKPQPLCVLVVEDEILIRLLITEELRDHGFTVMAANNADAAKAVLDAGNEVDLIFSDVRLPGAMNGVELARYVQSRYPGLPVILTSADVGSEVRAVSTHFVPKPYRILEVAKLISATLGLAGREDSE
jgi:CheY-like chemotaxis protein